MILALETSSSLCAVCLYDEASGKIMAEISNDIGRGHAERLMDDVEAALRQAGIGYADLTAIACGVGPGSFTGIRVGVAAARGLALALKTPARGVTSLQAIALFGREGAAGKDILAIQDAGRGEAYVQRFDPQARPAGTPQAMLLEALPSQFGDGPFHVCGSGANLLEGHAGWEISPEHSFSTAALVARAALDPAMTVAPKPLYLRAPDAKPQAGFSIARSGA
jgi:tRNA threonylcarbamoyladenosine biosynthesis protein TsaB